MKQSNISLWYNRKWSFHKENLACKKVDLFKEPRFCLTATNVPNLSHCPAPLCLIRCQPSYTFELSTSFNRENDNNLYLSVDILDSLSFPQVAGDVKLWIWGQSGFPTSDSVSEVLRHLLPVTSGQQLVTPWHNNNVNTRQQCRFPLTIHIIHQNIMRMSPHCTVWYSMYSFKINI